MKIIQNNQKIICKTIYFILVCFIILNPLINSFFGIDIGDTGIHYTNFQYLYSRTEIVGYSSVFTSIIGNLWLRIFPFLGIWGLNLLEVIIEWVISIIVFLWLKKYYGNIITLTGVALSSVLCGTYLNVFNYHQFSVLLILCLSFMCFKAIVEDKLIYSYVSGIFFVLATFARVSSVVCVSIYCLYIYVCIVDKRKISFVLHHAFVVFNSCALSVACFIIYMKKTGIAGGFKNSVFKLKKMSQTSGSTYSSSNLIQNFISGNIKTLASPFILLGAVFIISLALYYFVGHKNIVGCGVVLLSSIITYVLIKFSYDVNPVDGSPQFTTGPNFMMGILLFAGLGGLLLFRNSLEYNILIILSILLPVYTTCGSNTGTKHIIISSWLLMPLLIYEIKYIINSDNTPLVFIGNKSKIIVISIIVVSISFKFIHMVYYTNNFESLDRLSISETVHSNNTKYLKTTHREADALNGLINAYKSIDDDKLVVFGTGIGLYAVLDDEPCVRAYVIDSSYLASDFQIDMKNAVSFPAIVYCRTNQYFGFEEKDYNWLINMSKQTAYGGKKDVLIAYLMENNYKLKYINDYYCLFSRYDGQELTIELINEIFK